MKKGIGVSGIKVLISLSQMNNKDDGEQLRFNQWDSGPTETEKVTKFMLDSGLIVFVEKDEHERVLYKITEKGEIYLEHVGRTPIPKQVFIDERYQYIAEKE